MKDKTQLQNKILCPIDETIEGLPFPQEEITPLLDFLSNNQTVEGAHSFKRGTITPEKKLDCCKQDLGATGAKLLTNALKNNTEIESILFGTGGIGNEGAKSVAELLEQNQSIETVYLGCNLIEAEGANALAASLENNPTVRALWLKRNPIGDAGVKSIAQLLKKNRQLRSLDLVNTQIGLEGLATLVQALIEEDYPLERLYLSGNAFGPEAGEIIAQLLEQHKHLKELLLSVNCLGDKGTLAISEGLKKNQTLINLSLASNGITDESATHLLAAVAEHPNLQVLDLGYSRSTRVLEAKPNKLGDHTAMALKQLLLQNTQLYHLDLVKIYLTQKGLNAILEGLKNNKTLKELRLGKGFNGPTLTQIKSLLKQNLKENPDAVFKRHRDVLMIKSVYR